MEGKTQIKEVLKNAEKPIRARELSRKTDLSLSTVRVYLCELAGEGEIERVNRGEYAVKRSWLEKARSKLGIMA